MDEDEEGIKDESKSLCRTLLESEQTVPQDSLFRDDLFKAICQKIQYKNEAMVIQDITRLIVPSAQTSRYMGAKHLDILIETVNEGWNNSRPFIGTCPQPDYSVGFRREAFTEDQLNKLKGFGWRCHSRRHVLLYGHLLYVPSVPHMRSEVRRCGARLLGTPDINRIRELSHKGLKITVNPKELEAQEVEPQQFGFWLPQGVKIKDIYETWSTRYLSVKRVYESLTGSKWSDYSIVESAMAKLLEIEIDSTS
jgi:hypothetical protein